jgi:hypothetical protein
MKIKHRIIGKYANETLFFFDIKKLTIVTGCRIYVGDQLDRWNELKEVLRVQTLAEFANILLDR